MIVRQVGAILKEEGVSSITQLMARTGASRGVVEAAIEFWERRGSVCRVATPDAPHCAGPLCRACPLVDRCAPAVTGAEPPRFYSWENRNVDKTTA